MTNEEAIRFGNCILMVADDKSDTTTIAFTKLAIKALETIPKYKDAYGKGWIDGAKASYEHLKMCEEEQETYDFAEWVAREIFDEMWEYNKDAFAEIACRRLAKLGIVRAKGDDWELVEPEERNDEEISDTNLKMWQEIFKAESEGKR